MAQGTLLVYNEATQYFADGTIDLDTDDLKWILVTDSVAGLSQDTALPKLADYTGATTGGNYSGATSLASVTFNRSTAVSTLDAADISIASNGSNPTDAKTLILFSDTATATVDAAFAYVDLTTDGGTTAIDLTANNLNVNWNASGILTITRS
jgi:hypothetical protein